MFRSHFSPSHFSFAQDKKKRAYRGKPFQKYVLYTHISMAYPLGKYDDGVCV